MPPEKLKLLALQRGEHPGECKEAGQGGVGRLLQAGLGSGGFT